MRPYFACAVVLSLVAAGIQAQSPSDTLSYNNLPPVVVTAQFAPTDVRQTVNSVRVIDRKTIEQRAAVNLEELLQTEPNVRLAQDAVLGSALSINGLRGENVKILLDGVPVVGRLNGSVDAGQLPLGAVQQVEIIEGAQSLLYGSEAAAGVINLVSRKSQLSRFEAEAAPQWESNGFRNLQGRAGLRLGKFLVQLTGNRLDFQPQPDTTLGRDQLWNPKIQESGRALLRFSPSDKLDLRVTGGLFSEKVDNLGALRRPQYKPYAFDDYYFTDRADVTLHGEGRLPGQWFWQGTVGWNRFDRIKNSYRLDFEDERQTLLEGQQDTSAATGLLTRVTLASDRRDRSWNFLLGAENYVERAEGARIVDSTATAAGKAGNNDLGLFGSAKTNLFQRKLILQGGARWTHNRLYGTALTPSVWLLWQPTPAWQIRMSYANGFRSPGLKELYFNFIDINHFIVGNTELQPERSDNFRTELRWNPCSDKQKTGAGISISGFYNRVRDRIVLYEYAPTQYRYTNLNRWETTGGSMGVNFRAGDWLRVRSEVVLTGFFNTYSEGNNALRRFDWSPDWVNDLTFFFANQRGTLALWHKMTGPTPYFFEKDGVVQQSTTAGWHLLNASLGGRFFKGKIGLNAGVKNLLNTQQIRTGTDGGAVHGGGGDLRPVHWGRSFFITTTFFWST